MYFPRKLENLLSHWWRIPQSSDLAQSALTTCPLGVTQIKELGSQSHSAQALTPPEVFSTGSQSCSTHTSLNSQVPTPILKADDGVSQSILPSDDNYATRSVPAVSKEHVEDVKGGSVPGPTPSSTPAACADACNIEPFQPKPRDLTVTATLNGQDIKMLVDTGAGMSVVDEQFLRALYKGTLPELHGSSLSSVKTVSGEALPVLGKLQVVLQIAGGNYVCNLQVVKDLTYEAVLGRDFLRANGAVIKNGTLQLEDNHMQPHPARACSVHVLSTCVIPPSSEAMIPARLGQDSPTGEAGLIEASENLKVRYQLQGAAALVTVTADQTVPFRLINPTTKPVTLYKGATLGTFTSMNEDLQVSSLDTAPASQNNSTAAEPDVPVDLTNSDLTEAQKRALQNLVNEYRDIFATSAYDLGCTNLIRHHIDTGDHAPIRQRPYRVPESQKARIESCIQDMLDQGVIRPSQSAWASPVVLIKKPDGTDRFCCDLRKVNSVTKKDAYPLPRIADTLDALSGTQFYSSVDLQCGYWQVPLAEESKDRTAFITHAGLYEFNVMAFGLSNAPSSFQRLMECVLRGLHWKIALIYLDDVLVYSRTFEDHLQHLRLVFDRFRDAGLKLKPKKCHFGQKKVKYLGHVVSKEGVSPDPDKISAIKEYPVPRSIKDVRAFLGLANYYRKFVKGFAKIAGPLHDLTKKGLKFQWNESCQCAFDALKTALTQAPILAHPDFTLEFILATDASDVGLGYVLGQIQNGKEVAIAYGGRKLLPAEKNYSVTEKEALGVVAAIKHFQTYLYGSHFKIFTDHSAVSWLMNIKDASGRLMRWSLILQQYDFEIVHRPGLSNGNADALSRREYDTVLAALDSPGVQIDRVRELQRKDPSLADIIEYLEWEELPTDNKAAKKLLHTIEQYYLDPDGLLCHIWIPGSRRVPTPKSQLVIPRSLRHEVLLQGHDSPFSGHLGVNKTYAKLRDKYFWPKMYMDIQHYCLSCESCAMKKNPKQRTTAPVLPIPVHGPWDVVASDCCGPFVQTSRGNRYLVVFTDMCTRWCEAFAVPDIEAKTIAKLLVDEIISRHGAPRKLLTDRGSNYKSSLLKEVCALMGTHKIFTTAYHPQCDGLVERFNGSLVQSISMYVDSNQKNWDENLSAVLFGYRSAPSDTTGESPFYLMYGRDPVTPCDVALIPPREMSASVAEHRARVVENIEIARRISAQNIQRAQQKMKDLHDRFAEPTRFQLGERVWVYTPKNRKGLSKKLAHNWHGPFRIVEFLSPVHCILRAVDNRRVTTTVHVSRLKRYIDPSDRPTRVPVTDVDDPYLADVDLPDDSFAPEQQTSEPAPENSGEQVPVPPHSVEVVPDEESSAHSAEPLVFADDVYPAEKIVRHRFRNGQPQFLVKWLGFPNSHNTWENRENILDPRLLSKYYKDNPRAKRRLEADPEYTPRIASLSWTEIDPSLHCLAVITPQTRHAATFRPDQPFSRQAPLTTIPVRQLRNSELSHSESEAWDERDTPLIIQRETLHAVTHKPSSSFTSPLVPSPNASADALPRLPQARSVSSPPTGPRALLPLQGSPPTTPRVNRVPPVTKPTAVRLWLMLMFCGAFLHMNQLLVGASEFDAAGQVVGFYPKAMMLAKNPKPLVLYQDTKLVSLHMDLRLAPRIKSPDFNSSCDPALFKFYERVLSSLRGVQRATTRLFSIQGVTDLLECDSYLRRFYAYVTGRPSSLVCPIRHYANSLTGCKQWARQSCHVRTPQEREWLSTRGKRSSYWCHTGVLGIPRFFYELGGGSCDSTNFMGLIRVLREFASLMTEADTMMKTLDGKIVYLVKTTDLINSKLSQVINSLRLVAGAFTGWKQQFDAFADKQQCHFNLQQEFISIYSMEINRAFISLLRLTEVDDLLRQLSHLARRGNIGFADLPRFLTEEITLKLSTVPALAPAIDALRNGFAVMMNPLMDIQFQSTRNIALHLLFTLPELSSTQAVCTMEQLVPISYRSNGLCYGGTIVRHDLLLLTCNDKRFVLKQPDLELCISDSSTLLCPKDILTVIEDPSWLGALWSPDYKLSFTHAHTPLSNCNNLRTILHLGGRFYLATDTASIPIHSHNGSFSLPISPLHVYHLPCAYSFHLQATGLSACPSRLSFQFPLFHSGSFHFVPWQTVPLPHGNFSSPPPFSIPEPLVLDNSTLESLDQTYATLDQDFTRRLQQLRGDISSVHEVPHADFFQVAVFVSLALTSCNFVILIVVCCVLSKRATSRPARALPVGVEVLPLTSDQSTGTSL